MMNCSVFVQIIQTIFPTFLFTWPGKTLWESSKTTFDTQILSTAGCLVFSFENWHSLFFNLMKKLHFSTPLALIFNDFFFVHTSMNFYSRSVTGILAFSKRNEKKLKYREFKYFFTEINYSILKVERERSILFFLSWTTSVNQASHFG